MSNQFDLTTRHKMFAAVMSDAKTAENADGRAAQRMAALVMAEHSALVAAGKAATLIACCTPKTEARKQFMAHIDKLYNVPPTKPAKGKTSVTYDRLVLVHKAARAVIMRGLDMAAQLSDAGIGLLDYNDASGLFTVPLTMLAPIGCTPSSKGKTDVALDGTLYLMTDADDDFIRIRASVAQINKARDSRKPKPAAVTAVVSGNTSAVVQPSANGETGIISGANKLPAERLTGTFEDNILAAGRILAAVGNNKNDAVSFADLSADVRNALAAIVLFYDKAQETSASESEAKTKVVAVPNDKTKGLKAA